MLGPGWHVYSASIEIPVLIADTGDFFQLRGGGDDVPWKLLELGVFQRGTPNLTMETIRVHRGVGGSGGTALTEYEFATTGPTPTVAAFSLPTGDVASNNLIHFHGWNMLQELLILPTPELQAPFGGNDHLGINQQSGTAHTNVGVRAMWAEFQPHAGGG